MENTTISVDVARSEFEIAVSRRPARSPRPAAPGWDRRTRCKRPGGGLCAGTQDPTRHHWDKGRTQLNRTSSDRLASPHDWTVGSGLTPRTDPRRSTMPNAVESSPWLDRQD